MPNAHVALVEPFAPHTFLTVRWAQALHEAGASVTVVTFPDVDVAGVAASSIKPWEPMPAVTAPTPLRGRFNPASRLSVLAQFRAQTKRVTGVLKAVIAEHRPTHLVVSTTFATDMFALSDVPEPTKVLALVHGAAMAGTMSRRALLSYAGPRAQKTSHWLGCLTEELRAPFIEAGCDPARVRLAPASWTAFESRPTTSHPDGPVMFAGEAREEKGFGFFVRATPELLRDGPVRLQTYGLQDADVETRERVRALSEQHNDRLELIDSRVSDSEYEQMLASASMIAIPYDPDAYPRGRISQILSEAWAAGVPVISSRGWWASPIVEQFGGGALFDFGDADSMVAAAAEVRADHAGMSQRARLGHAEMLKTAGPDAFARFVLGL